MRKSLDFLILEVPARHADRSMIEVLSRKIEELMKDGCGVLWITDGLEIEGEVPIDLATGSLFYGKSRWTGDGDVVDD